MKKFLGMLTVVAAIGLAPVASSVAAPSVFFKPADPAVATGAPVTLGVWISGLQSINQVVAAFDLNIHLSNTNLSSPLVTYSAGAPLGSSTGPDPVFPDADFTSNAVDAQNTSVVGNSFLTDADLATLQAALSGGVDEFLLFDIAFTAGLDGVTLVSFTADPDKIGKNVTGLRGQYLPETTFGTACVRVGDVVGACDVQDVPEPSSYALAALGLLIAGVAGRKRGRSGSAA